MGNPALPIGFRIALAERPRLEAGLGARVTSDRPARFTVVAGVNVGASTVARVVRTGRTTSCGGRIVFVFSAVQRRRVRERVRATHRSATLYVRVQGTLPGDTEISYGFAHTTVRVR